MSRAKTFTCTLVGAGPNKAFPYIDELPFDTVAFFGTKGRVPVKITIHGIELASSLAPMGGRHVVSFSRAHALEAGIAVGDRVRVAIERDNAPRTVAVPPDLAKALESNPAATKAWDALAYSHHREHVQAIEGAKKPETRARRIDQTLAMLLTAKGKPERLRPSATPLVQRLHVKPGANVTVLAAPTGFSLGVPSSTTVKGADVVLVFVSSRAALAKWLAKVKGLPASTALWIAYPKTSSGTTTDLTRDEGWGAAERVGLRPVSQVAVDATWSALRFRVR